MNPSEIKQRYRVALRACIEAEDRRRAIPRGQERFEERFEWRLIAERCRLEYRRMQRQLRHMEVTP